MRPLRLAFAAVLLVLLGACATSTPPSAPATHAPVLLVSIDGFRSDYLDRGLTPRLSRFANEGVRAAWMTPSYPTLTFPNHYTLVTGLRPDRHGIVHNTMRDPVLGRFHAFDEKYAGDGRWWSDAEPIWVTAERAGLRTATMFWPGSQAEIRGVRPTRWEAYDESLSAGARVDRVLGWLSEPPATRPRLATLYFEALDTVGHAAGPDSREVDATLAELDGVFGRLLDGLAARGLLDQVNIVIVSDHGMAEVAPGHVVAVEDLVDPRDAEVLTTGQAIGVFPRPQRVREAEGRLLGEHAHHACWRRGELPKEWHYGTHARVPPIVCQMREGWDAIRRADIARRPAHARGSHGFDPRQASMRALFVARGPAFRSGVALAPFDNVDVYPLLARLLGVRAQPNDGDIAPLLPGLVEAGR